MNNRKVYIVTAGAYSDYRIVAVFSTKALAKKLIERTGDDADTWGGHRLEEYDLDQPVQLLQFKVWFTPEAKVACGSACDYHTPTLSAYDDGTLIVRVTASDAKEALKIASEKKTTYLEEKRLNGK